VKERNTIEPDKVTVERNNPSASRPGKSGKVGVGQEAMQEALASREILELVVKSRRLREEMHAFI